MHQSDERLVALARSGSERAWAEITRRYRRQLRSYCARFVGPSRAEDAVQQTFLQAFLALRDGQNREIALRAWLYRIAHNCSIDVLRKGSPDYDQLDLEYDGVPQPPMLFEQKEEIRGLVARMRSLPEAQRQALALRELEGRSYEEISARLGHSGSGVRQLIFRARTALRNGVAAIAPVGFLKGRLSQNMPFDCHHVASVAAPASSGNGIEGIGAATLAVVAVLGGGFAATDTGRRAKPARPAPTGATSPQPAGTPAIVAPAERPVASLGDPTRTGLSVRLPRPSAVSGPATETAPPVAAPPATVTPLPLPVAGDAPAAAPPAPAPAEPGTVRQQAIPITANQAPARPDSPGESHATVPQAGSTPAGTTAPPAAQPGGKPSKPVPAAAKPVKVTPPQAQRPKVLPPKVQPPGGGTTKVQPPRQPKVLPPKTQAPKTQAPRGPSWKTPSSVRKSERR